jgi:hypothetical protein
LTGNNGAAAGLQRPGLQAWTQEAWTRETAPVNHLQIRPTLKIVLKDMLAQIRARHALSNQQ